MSSDFYLDSSVGLRVLLGHSRSAAIWLRDALEGGDVVTSSSLHKLEVSRVALRENLDTQRVLAYFSSIDFVRASGEQIDRAADIPYYLKTLDTLHLQCALDLRAAGRDLAIVTHDQAMKNVAGRLGFAVHDPVTA